MNEDVFPIENGDIPASYVSLPDGIWESTHFNGDELQHQRKPMSRTPASAMIA